MEKTEYAVAVGELLRAGWQSSLTADDLLCVHHHFPHPPFAPQTPREISLAREELVLRGITQW